MSGGATALMIRVLLRALRARRRWLDRRIVQAEADLRIAAARASRERAA